HLGPLGQTRAIAFATLSAGAPFGGAFGIAIGGVATQLTKPSWRTTFFLNAAVTFLCIVGAFFFFDPDQPSTEVDRRVDWIGGFIVTVALVLIIFVLSQGEVAPNKWATPYIIALLIVGVIVLLLFLFWQYHLERLQDRLPPSDDSFISRMSGKLENLVWLPSPPPLMRVSLWSRAKARVTVVLWIAFLNWCTFQGWNYWVLLYYQNYIGFSPLRTLVRMLPMNVTGVICNIVFAALIGHVPMVVLIVSGTCLTGCAALLFAVINPNALFWAFGFPAAVLSVIGADFVFATGTIFVAKVCQGHEQSVGGALFQTMTQLGTSLGVTVSTVVFNRVLIKQTSGRGVVLGSNSPSTDAPREAQLDAYKAAQWTNFAFGMLATILGLIFLRHVGIIGRAEPIAMEDTERNSTMLAEGDSESIAEGKDRKGQSEKQGSVIQQ
ncbi:MFS general substrate transporter, partial [Dendrothele bispora CBS 962.96]